MRALFALLVLTIVIPCPACKPSAPPRGDLAGKVTYHGQPVEEGSIAFYDPQSGKGAQATIGPGGAYQVETQEGGLLLGAYRVFIMPPLIWEASDGGSPPVQVLKEAPNIPEKYRSEHTSGLEVTVREGDNTYNVDLRD